jgi:hypothetical protein
MQDKREWSGPKELAKSSSKLRNAGYEVFNLSHGCDMDNERIVCRAAL